MLRESVIMSRDNIFANKMRSFLTVLGIIIGVAAIIALVTVVENATDEITSLVLGLANFSLAAVLLYQIAWSALSVGITLTKKY